MTKKPKKRLFREPSAVVFFSLIPLVIFFAYAVQWNPSFFTPLQVSLGCIFFYLIIRYRSFIRYSATVNVARENWEEQINLLNARITQEQMSLTAVRVKSFQYSQLKGLVEKLNFCLSVSEATHTLTSETNKLFGHADTIVITYLFHSKTSELRIGYSQKDQKQAFLGKTDGDLYDQWMIKNSQPLLVEDTLSDFRFDIEKAASQEERLIGSLMGVPLLVGHKTLGILRVDSPHKRHFTIEDLRLLQTVGELGAVALENAQLYAHVEELAIKDGLTGLFLRRPLLERLPEEIRRHRRIECECSFLMIDLDEFKKYNDSFGHSAGDIVLKSVSQVLAEKFRMPGDIVCRFGGEEFAVFLPECPKEKAIRLAQELFQILESQSLVLRRQKTHVTISLGIASFPGDADSDEELIRQADRALYLAKQKGRNRIEYFQ